MFFRKWNIGMLTVFSRIGVRIMKSVLLNVVGCAIPDFIPRMSI